MPRTNKVAPEPESSEDNESKQKKASIPIALREAVWVTYNGARFECKCHVAWCKNMITPFSYHVGHNVPESKGGATDVGNLRPICAKCNLSMGNRYTIDAFSALSRGSGSNRWLACFR